MREPDVAPKGLAPPLYAVVVLPSGMVQGFISVTLAWGLRKAGVSVAAIAGLASLYLLPTTCQFLISPFVDVTLSPRRWYFIALGAIAACFGVFAVLGPGPQELAAYRVVAVIVGVAIVSKGVAGVSIVAATTAVAERGPVAGWAQAANLGGAGIGGGAALWIATHGGGERVAALILAGVTLLCATPMLRVRTAPNRGSVSVRIEQSVAALWRIARSRDGVLGMIIAVLPAALGAATGLLPAVAGDWRASADLVAAVNGVLGGLACIPGSLIGGYLCRRHHPRRVYWWASLAFAAGEAVMAIGPHTPASFVVMALSLSFVIGIAWGSLSGVTFNLLGESGAATTAAVMGSAANIPVVVVTALVGRAETRLGSGGMLLTEAALGATALFAFAALAWLWKPELAAVPAAA